MGLLGKGPHLRTILGVWGPLLMTPQRVLSRHSFRGGIVMLYFYIYIIQLPTHGWWFALCALLFARYAHLPTGQDALPYYLVFVSASKESVFWHSSRAEHFKS